MWIILLQVNKTTHDNNELLQLGAKEVKQGYHTHTETMLKAYQLKIERVDIRLAAFTVTIRHQKHPQLLLSETKKRCEWQGLVEP